MDLSEVINQYGQAKKQANQIYTEYKKQMILVESLRFQLQEKLNDVGLRSAKSADFGVSIVSKPIINVTNEQSVVEWLKTTPNIEYDQYIGLKLTPFKSMALEYLKQTGEVINGTEFETKETISIKANK